MSSLVAALGDGAPRLTLKGATGTGKTFAMSQLIQQAGKPTLLLAPNKVLAVQLWSELVSFFPDNAVEYFVSYYDYYRPESYAPTSDTYLQKSAAVNEDIDRMRHAATASLLSRNDVIVVASVSCIYGLGVPELYESAALRCAAARSSRRTAAAAPPRAATPTRRRRPGTTRPAAAAAAAAVLSRGCTAGWARFQYAAAAAGASSARAPAGRTFW